MWKYCENTWQFALQKASCRAHVKTFSRKLSSLTSCHCVNNVLSLHLSTCKNTELLSINGSCFGMFCWDWRPNSSLLSSYVFRVTYFVCGQSFQGPGAKKWLSVQKTAIKHWSFASSVNLATKRATESHVQCVLCVRNWNSWVRLGQGILWTGATPTAASRRTFFDAPSMGSCSVTPTWASRVRNNLIKDCFLKKRQFRLLWSAFQWQDTSPPKKVLKVSAVTWWSPWAPWVQGMAWTSHLVRRWTCMLPCPPHGRRPRSPKDYCHPNLGFFISVNPLNHQTTQSPVLRIFINLRLFQVLQSYPIFGNFSGVNGKRLNHLN